MSREASRAEAAGVRAGGRLPEGYSPIQDYAAIGDCHGSALVSRDGSVDWCSLGRFDSDPIFLRLLDARKGGFLSVRPEDEFRTQRRYLPNTNVLRTTFHTAKGRVSVTDFMPVGRRPGSGVHDYVTLVAPFWLVRIVEGIEGRVRLGAAYRPSRDWGRRPAEVRRTEEGLASPDGPFLAADLGWTLEGDLATASFEVGPGERRALVISPTPMTRRTLEERVDRLLEITLAFWREWTDYCRYTGPYRDRVLRSALTLKLLTYAPTGAIVAAPTTSLPEEIGGVRNWDYRFCWLRDASFTLYSLAKLGYSGEADDFSEFLIRACASEPELQVLYGVGGETDLPELALGHLDGYRASGPVRIGNAAALQRQLDIYGQVLDWAYLFRELGGRLGDPRRRFLRGLAEFVARHWEEPDDGIWEARSAPRHYVHGKIMCWVALDRAIRLLGPDAGLARARDAVREAVLERGVDPDGGHLCQAFGIVEPDAALLLTPLIGFPLPPAVLERTLLRIEERLRRGDFLYRYRTDDGLPGGEGAFLVCSFWLVDALMALDRGEEARALFERLLAYANDLGLYAEQIDVDTGDFLGNFPQGLTHLGLVQAAVNLEVYAERGPQAMTCTHADRARFAVDALHGPRAVWAAFRKTGRVGRVFSSGASVLPSDWGPESAPEDWRMAARGWPLPARALLSPFAARASGTRGMDRKDEKPGPDRRGPADGE